MNRDRCRRYTRSLGQNYSSFRSLQIQRGTMEVQHDAPVAHVQSSPKDPQAQDIGDDYEIPLPEPSDSFAALKDRIKHHYEIASDYYYSLWYVHAATRS